MAPQGAALPDVDLRARRRAGDGVAEVVVVPDLVPDRRELGRPGTKRRENMSSG